METLRALSKQIYLFFWHMGCHRPHMHRPVLSTQMWWGLSITVSLAAAEGGQATSSTAPSLLWVLGRDRSEGCCLLACKLQP